MKILSLLFAMSVLLDTAALPNTHALDLRNDPKYDNDSSFIYKKVYPENAGDLDAEGDICLFEPAKNRSFTIARHEVLDKTEAWRTPTGNVIVFRSFGISILNQDGKTVEEFHFDSNQRVIGANYHLGMNFIFFLLMDEKTREVDLCRLSLKGLELKKLKRNLKIALDDGEAPFKKLFFDAANHLLIENDCNSILSVELYGNYNLRTLQFNTEECNGYAFNFNNSGIIYLKYKDKKHDLYDIRQYDLSKNQIVTLFTGKNTNHESAQVDIYTNKDKAPFVIGIDNKFYVYDYHSFRQLMINGNADIVHISSDAVYYLINGKINYVNYYRQ